MRNFTLAVALIIMIAAPLTAGAQTRATFIEGKVIKAQDTKGLSVRDSDGTTRTLTDSDGLSVTGVLAIEGNTANPVLKIERISAIAITSPVLYSLGTLRAASGDPPAEMTWNRMAGIWRSPDGDLADIDAVMLEISPPVRAGGNSVTGTGKRIGILIKDVDEAGFTGSNYAIYSAASEDSYFAGKMGIGIAPAVGVLHVEADAITYVSALFGDDTAGQADSVYFMGNSINASYNYDNDTTPLWLNFKGYQAGSARFRDVSIGDGKTNEIAFFDGSSGDFGVGVTPAFRLDVKDDVSDSYVANFFNDGDNADRFGISIQAGADDGSGDTVMILFSDGDGDAQGALVQDGTSGDIEIAQGVPFPPAGPGSMWGIQLGTTTTLDTASIIRQTHVIDYDNWQTGKRKRGNFDPDQLAIIFPEATGIIPTTKQLDTGTTQTIKGVEIWVWDVRHRDMKVVYPLKFIPVLVREAQKQGRKIEQQQAQIDENEANIGILETNQKILWLAVFGSMILGGGFSELRRRKS